LSKKRADYRVENHGSLYLVQPLNGRAGADLEDHVGEEAQWWGTGLAVEPRYITSLVSRLQESGWRVE
jgi:hypothetical protein